MQKENTVIYDIHIHPKKKKKRNPVIYGSRAGTGDRWVTENEPDTDKPVPHDPIYMWPLRKYCHRNRIKRSPEARVGRGPVIRRCDVTARPEQRVLGNSNLHAKGLQERILKSFKHEEMMRT